MTFLDTLSRILPPDRVSTHPDHLSVASRDESTLPGVTPLAVVWPLTIDEISNVVKACVESRTSITTRGAGSALEGSTIPCPGGIVLDVSKMTRILNYWPDDLQIEIEPGIIYDHLNNHLKRDGLFFPPSPGGSGDIATVGGMVSTNASGIYSVKYGGTKEYVLSLTVVTGTGEIVTLGNRAVKRSSGYNLVELICGSEGTLGIIGSITLKLAGIPEDRLQSAFVFPSETSAAKAVSEIRRCGIDIAAIEFLDRHVMGALNQLKAYGLKEVPSLFLEFHGPKPVLESNAELSEGICTELGGIPLMFGEGHRPWEIRHWVTDSIKHAKPGYKIIRNDVAFPISALPEMVDYCHELGQSHRLPIYTFGHVGLGLLHALMLARPDDTAEWQRALDVNDQIIKKTLKIGGTISGEHGIGLGHKNLFKLEAGSSLALMRQIKKQFDSQGILNPGKIFDI